jgi:NAD(P)H-nitrite reductase large subunit
MLATSVARIDTTRQELVFDTGRALKVERVLLATGARARMPGIRGMHLPGVATLRTADDANQLCRQWQAGQRLVIVGGGLIGCEVATTARKLGLDVSILEDSEELLQRVLGHRIGRWCRQRLEALGISVRLRTSVVEFTGTDRITGVVDADGRILPADSVIVSVGAACNTTVAELAGIDCAHGITVDDCGRTKVPGIFAAGDAASWPLRTGGRRSLGTYINSQRQAVAAASAMLGKPRPSPQLPLSWTEIAGHHIQVVGDIAGRGEYVTRGDLEDGPTLLFRLDSGEVQAAVSIDAPREFAMATRLVDAGARTTPEVLGDTGIELRTLYQPARKQAATP